MKSDLKRNRKKNKKFTIFFVAALVVHLVILAMFGINFNDEAENEIIEQSKSPEIIQATLLDSDKIQQQADRLRIDETNKEIAQQQKQKTLEDNLKREQQRLEDIKKERLQEEIKTKELEKKRKELALKEKQKREELNKLKAEETARLAKIKAQKQADDLRAEVLRKAEEKKREMERLAEQKKQKEIAEKKTALIAKQKADEARKKKALAKQRAEKERKDALAKQHAADISAKMGKEKQTIGAFKNAIIKKVTSRWVKPLASTKRVKPILRIKLLPSGDVMDVTIVKSSGDSLFDRSALNAVRKAEPLPVPKDRSLFSKNFRSFTFIFDP